MPTGQLYVLFLLLLPLLRCAFSILNTQSGGSGSPDDNCSRNYLSRSTRFVVLPPSAMTAVHESIHKLQFEEEVGTVALSSTQTGRHFETTTGRLSTTIIIPETKSVHLNGGQTVRPKDPKRFEKSETPTT